MVDRAVVFSLVVRTLASVHASDVLVLCCPIVVFGMAWCSSAISWHWLKAVLYVLRSVTLFVMLVTGVPHGF